MAHRKIVDGSIQFKPVLDWLYSMMTKGIQGGAIYVEIGRHEEARTLEQNSKQWPMYTDLSNQVEWYGEKLSPEHWKELLSNDWRAQKIVPGIGGGFCALGVKTSKLTKREMSELIELVYAFGANHGVKWSEPSLVCYQSYKEAQ